MNAEELISAGQPEEALAAVQQDIRKNPGDARLRIFLFQLLSILGSWEKALTQLNVLRDLNADCMLLAQVFRPAVECEPLREAIFAGKRGPMIFGEPVEWIGRLVAANQLLAEGQVTAASDLREQAFEAAPATTGSMNGQPFAWIADADSRLGPMLEVIIDGKYYWVPFFRIRSIHIEPPQDLRDMVWTAAQFTWANGGENPGLIPTRYAGTATLADSRLRLARLTEWTDKSNETFIGFGQRILATDVEETPLLEVRTIEIHSDAGAPTD
jgi:type VI secretion system protein ImpE